MLAMKRICAWCRKDLDGGEARDIPEPVITHGICPTCARESLRQLSEPLQDFLDRFEQPILLVGGGPRIVTGNLRARELLAKDLAEIQERPGGEVINCAYASTPEGCGNEIHCQSCTIRNTVLETFATGRSFCEVPAYPDLQILDDIKKVSLRISTEKVGEFVFLRIDDLESPAPE